MDRQLLQKKRKQSKIYRRPRDRETLKIRRCLKCGKEFDSYLDARLCDNCRGENDRVYGGSFTEFDEQGFSI